MQVERNMKLVANLTNKNIGLTPLTILISSTRTGSLIRLVQRLSETSVRRMAMFRAKKIYIQFRPI